MSALTLNNISFSRGSDPLFENLSLSIRSGDRIGLVGHNGSGKSTLMSLIVGDESPDEGEIQMPRGQRIALVEQFVPSQLLSLPLEQAVLNALSTNHQHNERYRAETLLHQLNFRVDQWSVALGSLSGGEQNLALLARALLVEPELLLMDEPGNHMDVLALNNLRSFLCSDYRQPFLMISHDRELLDTCCNRTVFLRDKQVYSFDMPYEAAKAALQEQDEQAAHSRQTEQKEIDRLQASAKRLAQWGKVYDNENLSRKAKVIQQRAERLRDDRTFVSKGSGLDLKLQSDTIRAKSVLTLEGLKVTTPDASRLLLECEFHRIKPGDRIALLGKNGVGKSSTLNRILNAFTSPDDSIRFNPNASLGFYDQELREFASNSGRFDWLRDRVDGADERIKHVLLEAGVAFTDFSRPVNTLSGGECARLMFMLFRLNQPNFLILDEPTNHIDVEGREQLEQQLIDSGATLLITSHDRRFIERIASRWWWINQESVREVHDLETFYTAITDDPQIKAHGAGQDDSLETNSDSQVLSEDKALERIETLEKLLTEDRARKKKFQKPAKQHAWEMELNQLWSSLTPTAPPSPKPDQS